MKCSIRHTAVIFFTSLMVFLPGAGWSEEEAAPAPQAEPELIIVKYGSLLVKSSEPGARVYVDETYKGSADTVVESIVTGEHVISCRTEDKTVSGSFQVKKNETLRLEARFGEGKLVLLKETVKAEPEKKKPEPVKREKPKKIAEPKKVEQKNSVEERRKAHFNVMSLDYEIGDTQNVKVQHAANQHVISKFSLRKKSIGKYYRTKQAVLLCDAGPCEMSWSASFIYTDETNEADAFLLNWKETVFNGITPAGTSRQDLECCLDGQCWKMQDTGKAESQDFDIGRYRLTWSKTAVLIRRSDIMKEILEAGRELSDYR